MEKLLVILALIAFQKFAAQVTVANNFGAAADYVGWNAFQLFPLRIEHQGVFPINFTTAGNGNQVRFTTLAFGAPLYFGSLIPNGMPGNRLSRVAISYDGNNPVATPVSALHIGYNPGAGQRHWMGNGVFIAQGSDNCFFGLRNKDQVDLSGRTSLQFLLTPSSDNNDAVINWGDNGAGPVGPGTDNLTFIHTDQELPGGNLQNSNYGREIMRMTGNGNVGIGPEFLDNAQPQNMLHLNNAGTNPAAIQISNVLGTGQTAADGFLLGFGATKRWT